MCSKLACLFNLRPPFRQREVAAYPSPSFLFRRDKSPLSLPAASYNLLRRYEASAHAYAIDNRRSTAFTLPGVFSIRHYNRTRKPTDKMSCPVRDSASEQLNDYKKKVKVTSWFLDYACILWHAMAQRRSNATSVHAREIIISRKEIIFFLFWHCIILIKLLGIDSLDVWD